MLVGGKHQRYQHEQIKRHEIDRQRIGQHTEQRRHQAGAEIGAGHLHADNGLGFVRAEVIRRRMDQTGIIILSLKRILFLLSYNLIY